METPSPERRVAAETFRAPTAAGHTIATSILTAASAIVV
jgi:hypothetical protein